MKKSKISLILISFILLCTMILSACADNNSTKTNDTNKTGEVKTSETTPGTQEDSVKDSIKAIAGDYLLDASSLGMNMSWYINIGTDGNFKISTKRDYSVDKGTGKVTESNGTFVLLYNGSNNENAKTAEFTVENGNLIFSTAIPVGTATVSAEGPIKVLSLAYEDVLGEYVGVYEKNSAMMGTILYNIDFELSAGKSYSYSCSFDMGGDIYNYLETGTFSINGEQITITALQKSKGMTTEPELSDVESSVPVSGTIKDGKISITLNTTSSSTAEVELQTATTADIAGTYYAVKSTAMFSINANIKIDKIGGFTYNCDFASGMMDNATVAIKGTLVKTDSGLKLSPISRSDDGGDFVNIEAPADIDVTLENLVLSGKMPTPGMATDLVFYNESVSGAFAASNEEDAQEGDTIYNASLILAPDGTFTLAITNDGTTSFEAEGTFTIAKTYYTQLQLSYDDGASTLLGVISSDGIQITDVPVDNIGDTSNFMFAKETLPLVEETVYGSYIGTYEKVSPMMGTILYSIDFELNDDNSYNYSCSFDMSGDTYKYLEAGTFSVNGDQITITALQKSKGMTTEPELSNVDGAEPVTGTINDGKISINLNTTSSSTADVELNITTDSSNA